MIDIWPDEVTPPIDHPVVKTILDKLGLPGSPVLVKRASKSKPVGNCYWNVEEVIERKGGSMVLGWAIMWWPDLYVTAMHHAVWRTAAGTLIDVTAPQPPDRAERTTLFFIDATAQIDLEHSPTIDNFRVHLSENDALTEYDRLYIEKNALIREALAIQWDAGYRNQAQFALARGQFLTPELSASTDIEEHFHVLTSEIDELNARIGQIICELKSKP